MCVCVCLCLCDVETGIHESVCACAVQCKPYRHRITYSKYISKRLLESCCTPTAMMYRVYHARNAPCTRSQNGYVERHRNVNKLDMRQARTFCISVRTTVTKNGSNTHTSIRNSDDMDCYFQISCLRILIPIQALYATNKSNRIPLQQRLTIFSNALISRIPPNCQTSHR